MKSKMIGVLISMLMKTLTPELLKSFADMALDFVEEKVKGTKSPVDDAIVLPICSMIRSAFDVPDKD